MDERFPLMLEECPTEALPFVVDDALSQLTLVERLALGAKLPAAVGLRAEANLANGMDPCELDLLLTAEDVAICSEIVRPYLVSLI